MDEKCLPCEITVVVGMLIQDFCKKDCNEIVKEFQEGSMSIRRLQEKLKIPEEALEPFKRENTPLDITLAEAVNKHNEGRR